jgi:hypothetical protein
MARVKKSQPDLNSIFFSTPAQRVVRLLLSEPTTAFTPRVICSRLKGVRGLGGTEGLAEILDELHGLGLVDFVSNQRAVRVQDENTAIQVLASFLAICDLEHLKIVLKPLSSRGVLYGNRAAGKGQSDSDYDLFVVSDTPEEVRKAAGRHPMGRGVALVVWTSQMYSEIQEKDPILNQKLGTGIVLWGSTW